MQLLIGRPLRAANRSRAIARTFDIPIYEWELRHAVPNGTGKYNETAARLI